MRKAPCLRLTLLLLSSASQPAGIYRLGNILVAAVVVMAAVMVVNVVVDIIKWSSGCLSLPVAALVEWLPVVAHVCFC